MTAVSAEVAPKEVVVKVQARGWLSRNYGTGWCLDPDCQLVVTNHHVAKMVGAHAAIRGVNVTESLSATGESDEGAEPLATAIGPMKLAWVRDIALLALAEPLGRKGLHGLPFYLGELHPDQKVTVIGYPGGKLESVRGKFLEEQREGLLLFELERDSSRGFSGGLIVDEQGRAVGLLFAAAADRPRFVYAVPLWSLADFVRKVRPQLGSRLFAGDLYRPEPQPEDGALDVFAREFPAPAGDGFSPTAVLPQAYLLPEPRLDTTGIARNDVSPSVLALRRHAQLASRNRNNFVARQTLLLANGRAWQHEVQVIDGRQRFRPLAGGKDRFELPLESVGPVPGAEWADLVNLIASNSLLAVRFEREFAVNNHQVKEFRYQARAADQVCGLRIARAFHKTWKGSLACSGLIWTDDQFRILRITRDMILPHDSGLASHSTVVTYGWWGDRLVPVEMYLRSRTADGKTFSARAKFDSYRVFTATSKIVSSRNLPLKLRGE